MGFLMNWNKGLLDCEGAKFEIPDLLTYPLKSPLKMALNGGPPFFRENIHTFTIEARESEFGTVEPLTFKIQPNPQFLYNAFPQQNTFNVSGSQKRRPAALPVQQCNKDFLIKQAPYQQTSIQSSATTVMPPPKKKWIKEYLEEEPSCPVRQAVQPNGIIVPNMAARQHQVAAPTPQQQQTLTPAVSLQQTLTPAVSLQQTLTPAVSLQQTPPAHNVFLPEMHHEHSRPIPSIPSPSSSASSSSLQPSMARAGTREVHNKLEKNRRAHLKECFELLKRQLPVTSEDKKTSNLAILGSAIRFIHVLKRKERECEHELERLAREKISAQSRLAALKREVTIRQQAQGLRPIDPKDDLKKDEAVNGQILGLPINITSAGTLIPIKSEPIQSISMASKLPVPIAPQDARKIIVTNHGVGENGLAQTISTTLVHPAHIHLPISQVVREGSLVVAGALQLVSGPNGSLRVLQPNGTAGRELTRITRENGTLATSSTSEGVVVTPLVVSQALISHSNNNHHITHKMVESQVMNGHNGALSVNAQYVGVVKPMVVVTSTEQPSTST